MNIRFWKFKNRAFTLLECLVALLVISGSVLVIEGLSKLLHQEMLTMQNLSRKDWQSFNNQMRSELEGATFIKVEDNFLYVKNSKSGNIRFGQVAGSDDFRKADDSGRGYQPMIYGLESSQITKEKNKVIKIDLHFQKGGERIFYYQF